MSGGPITDGAEVDGYDALVGRLASGLVPVGRPWPLWSQLAAWSGVAVVTVLAVAVLTPRPDLAVSWETGRLAGDVLALGLVGLMLAVAALRSAVPGAASVEVTAAMLAAGLTIAALLAATWPLDGGTRIGAFAARGLPCAAMTLGLALVPALVVLGALSRGLALTPGVSGAAAGAAGTVVAVLAMRLHCPVDEGLHQLGWHVAVAVPMGALGAVILAAVVRATHGRVVSPSEVD